MTHRAVVGGPVLAALLWAAPAEAQFDDLFISGFVSQGYFNTSGNEYLVDKSEKGTAEFNEAALVFYSHPTDRVRIGAQLLARDFGNIGNSVVVLDWAFGDYQWKDELGFRVGKVRLPWGLYNQIRDVDVARDQIFLPQSVYNEEFRDFLLAYEGAGAYGRVDFEDAGELSYELWGGTFNVPDATRGFWGDFFQLLGRAAAPDIQELVGGGSDEIDVTVRYGGVLDPVVSFPWAFGGALFWDTPVEGLRAGVAGLRTEVDGNASLLYNVAVDSVRTGESELFRIDLPAQVQFDVDVLLTASIEYVRDRWTVAAEYTYSDTGGDIGDGWYGLLSYGVTDRLAITSYYSETYDDRNNRSGDGFHLKPAFWHKDLAVGARFDLTDHWRVKYEHHFVDGLLLIDEAGFNEADNDLFERKWNYFALKSTFHF
jgi:hypothetical protein